MDEEKIGRGLGAAVGPQQGPGAEPLVGVKGAKLFHSYNMWLGNRSLNFHTK
jgi:hypothetical protein